MDYFFAAINPIYNSIKAKTPLTELSDSVKDDKVHNTLRGATLIHGKAVRLAGYFISPANNVCLQRRRILRNIPFDCALSGPFDNVFLT